VPPGASRSSTPLAAHSARMASAHTAGSNDVLRVVQTLMAAQIVTRPPAAFLSQGVSLPARAHASWGP
jgi:hypothetical protein